MLGRSARRRSDRCARPAAWPSGSRRRGCASSPACDSRPAARRGACRRRAGTTPGRGGPARRGRPARPAPHAPPSAATLWAALPAPPGTDVRRVVLEDEHRRLARHPRHAPVDVLVGDQVAKHDDAAAAREPDRAMSRAASDRRRRRHAAHKTRSVPPPGRSPARPPRPRPACRRWRPPSGPRAASPPEPAPAGAQQQPRAPTRWPSCTSRHWSPITHERVEIEAEVARGRRAACRARACGTRQSTLQAVDERGGMVRAVDTTPSTWRRRAPAVGYRRVQFADELRRITRAADAALIGHDDNGVAGAVQQAHGVDRPRDRCVSSARSDEVADVLVDRAVPIEEHRRLPVDRRSCGATAVMEPRAAPGGGHAASCSGGRSGTRGACTGGTTPVGDDAAARRVRRARQRRRAVLVGGAEDRHDRRADGRRQVHGAGIVRRRRRARAASTPASAARSVRPHRSTNAASAGAAGATPARRAISGAAAASRAGADEDRGQPAIANRSDRQLGETRPAATAWPCRRPHPAPSPRTPRGAEWPAAPRPPRAGRR